MKGAREGGSVRIVTQGSPPADDRAAWREERRAAAEEHAAAARRREANEAAQARTLVEEFARAAVARGIPTAPLRARAQNGNATYRTQVEGWYLRRNASLGADPQGRFYVLNVPASLSARWRGVEVAPSDPPLVVGRGGRDGESIDLPQLLAQRLEAGADFP